MTTTPPGGEPGPTPGPDNQDPGGQDPGGQDPGGTTATDDGPAAGRAGPDGGPRVSAADVRDLGPMRRTVGPDRYVAGVGGGLARHLDVDPVVVRVAFAVLVFFGGAGLLLYAVAWLVVPEEGADRARLSMDPRSRTVALVGAGVLAALALLGDTLGGDWFPWPLALVALLVFLLLTRRDRRNPPPAPVGYGGSPGATAPYPGTEATGWAPPPGTRLPPPAAGGAPPPPPPRNPRRRGPRLFPVTLAAIAFVVGLLGVVDVAGVAVAPPVYPALALGVVAAMLLLASVWGRGGGLIALGLLGAVVLAATSAADRVEGDRVAYHPASAGDVRAAYDIGAGELVLDLSRVADPDALDGRTIRLHGGIGRVEVIVPEDTDVEASAAVDGPGGLTIFEEDTGGVDTSVTAEHDGGEDVPRLRIDADLGVGEIEVRTR